MDGKSLDILSEKLCNLKTLIPEAFTENEIDIILDFFAGLGTIAQAVMELNK